MRKRLGGIEETKTKIVEYANYMIQNQSTIRATAEHFDINFSKLHRYFKKILPETDSELYSKIEILLETNRKDRHLRGGEATHNRFKN